MKCPFACSYLHMIVGESDRFTLHLPTNHQPFNLPDKVWTLGSLGRMRSVQVKLIQKKDEWWMWGG